MTPPTRQSRSRHTPEDNHLALVFQRERDAARRELTRLRGQLREAVGAFDALEQNAYDGFEEWSSVLISRPSFERLAEAIDAMRIDHAAE